MNKREQIIRDYFDCWLKKDGTILKEIFDSKIVYSECYGPEYHGEETVEQWFEDWNKHGNVLEWRIKQFIHASNMMAVEWYFKCEYDGQISAFDGVSLVEFGDDDRIMNLKEFESKTPHTYPYE